MAKDPAFLFYPGDYLSGTLHLDFECKGAYIDLLMLQFQKDRMTIHMIQHMLGHKFDHIWTHIYDKFQSDGTFYWNERLRIEKEKRIRYCKSRKDNKNKDKHMFNHMSEHMENENENENNIDKVSSKNKKNGSKFVNLKTQGSDLLAKRIARNIAAKESEESRKENNSGKT